MHEAQFVSIILSAVTYVLWLVCIWCLEYEMYICMSAPKVITLIIWVKTDFFFDVVEYSFNSLTTSLFGCSFLPCVLVLVKLQTILSLLLCL